MATKKKKFDFSTMHLGDIPKFIIALFKGQIGPEEQMMSEQTGFYEINLVPDVKAEMIKAQKIRNLVFFICIAVSALSASTAVILGSIKGTQDITMAGQDSHIENLSKKINSYDELPEFLTIQNQLRGISAISNSQNVLSRAIILLNALIPKDGDLVEVSEVSVDLTSGSLSFDANADARAIGQDPIDYRVLESFIKRTNMMTFDYGRYVDASGKEIPSRCIEEYDVNGNMYQENGSIYAIWRRGATGCDPGRDDFSDESTNNTSEVELNVDLESTKMNNGTSDVSQVKNVKQEKDDSDDEEEAESTDESDLNLNTTGSEVTGEEDKEKVTVKNFYPNEKIYRTPQFTDWYKNKPWKTKTDGIDDQDVEPSPDGKIVYNTMYYKYTPSMRLDGSITDIPHFESECIEYTGEEDGDDVKWSANNICKLVPDDMQVTDSSNGRDADENLVLTFHANIGINADAFAFRNKHVMAIGPNGQNVTDSYVQLEKLFAAPAVKCDASDSECNNTPTSRGTGN